MNFDEERCTVYWKNFYPTFTFKKEGCIFVVSPTEKLYNAKKTYRWSQSPTRIPVDVLTSDMQLYTDVSCSIGYGRVVAAGQVVGSTEKAIH